MLPPECPPPRQKKNDRRQHANLPIRTRDELKTNDNQITKKSTKAKKYELEETFFVLKRPQRDFRLSSSVPEAAAHLETETSADWSDWLPLIVSASVNLTMA